jgi:hypothetical protein
MTNNKKMGVSDTGDVSGAAIVCVHVAKEGYPILQAERDSPVFSEDSGWQFLCNSGRAEDESELQVWSLDEVFEHEPTLAEFRDSPPGTTFVRDGPKRPWSNHVRVQ